MAKIVFESEAELEEMIYNAQQEGHCQVIDERIDDSYRQQPLGSYGVMDILGVQYGFDEGIPKVRFIVYEIKKETIKNEAVAQISRYIAGLHHIISENTPIYEWDVVGVLVAPQVDMSGDTCFLCDQAEDVSLYTAEWDLTSGLKFTEGSGWHKADSGLCSKTESMLSAVHFEMKAMISGTPRLEVCK